MLIYVHISLARLARWQVSNYGVEIWAYLGSSRPPGSRGSKGRDTDQIPLATASSENPDLCVPVSLS